MSADADHSSSHDDFTDGAMEPAFADESESGSEFGRASGSGGEEEDELSDSLVPVVDH